MGREKDLTLGRKTYKLSELSPFNNFNNQVFQKNNKYIKSYVTRANGLIESIIHSTLNYYTLNNFTTYVNIVNKSNNNRLEEVMNKANGISLENYIINLFNSENSNILNKKNKLLHILKKIAENLYQLQNICGFIHGDLNEQNIFIDDIDKKVLFIDFGRSTVKIPLYDKQFYILSSPVNENINSKYPLDISLDTRLKGIDLFYLIENYTNHHKPSSICLNYFD
jgi:serine/threonine protein kinase